MRIVHVGYHKGLNDNEPTPKYFYKELNARFHFTFDPCPPNPKFDGLAIEWRKRNYVNPPYSKKVKWIEKAIHQQKKGRLSVMLLPVDTSTSWYHDLIVPNAKVEFIRGRLNLDSGKHPAYASMIAIFHPKL